MQTNHFILIKNDTLLTDIHGTKEIGLLNPPILQKL